MDPNAALEEIRSIVANAERQEFMSDHTADRLVELVGGLDEWISKGGFLPDAWQR